MCIHSKYIYNKYLRKSILVKCGKCPACLEEKSSARTVRIRNHYNPDYVCFFITLTYDNEHIPYIKYSDIFSLSEDYSSDVLVYRGNFEPSVIGSVSLYFNSGLDDVKHLKTPKGFDSVIIDGSSECPIGICFYKDLQDFFKRLRINLKRKYNYVGKLSYFVCTEYGPTSFRPHAHLLLFVQRSFAEKIPHAVVESWPFADRERTLRFIDYAKNAASYVSSYVNCDSSLPSFLQQRTIRQKHVYSKNFGLGIQYFSLSKILEMLSRRNLRYPVEVFRDGGLSVDYFLVPKYVINRFFPKFKGYSRLSDNSLRKLLLSVQRYAYEQSFAVSCDGTKLGVNDDFIMTADDIHAMAVRLTHCIEYFSSVVGLSFEDSVYIYPFYYTDIWNCYFSNALEDSFKNFDVYNHFENISFSFTYENFPFPYFEDYSLVDADKFQLDPNLRSDIVVSDAKKTSLFFKKTKTKKVVNKALSEQNFNL